MDLEHILELVALGGSEDHTGSQAGVHLGAVEMHPPMGGVWRWRQVLGLGSVDEEVVQCLRLDGDAGLVVDGVGSQLNGPFGHSARSISASMISASGVVQTTVIGCS